MAVSFSTLSILLAVSVMLHVTEEFLFPGGFPEWYARLIPPKTVKKTNSGFLVWINTLMMCACALLFILVIQYMDIQYGIMLLP
jgi:hypothetical protein